MKEITIDKNSWHYVVATKMAGYKPHWDYDEGGYTDDICRYRRNVIGGLAVVLIAASAIAAISFAFFEVIFGIVFSIIYGAWIFSLTGEVLLIVLGVVAAYGVLIFTFGKISDIRRRARDNHERNPKPDGFVKQAYKSWKDKYCAKIRFVDGNKE